MMSVLLPVVSLPEVLAFSLAGINNFSALGFDRTKLARWLKFKYQSRGCSRSLLRTREGCCSAGSLRQCQEQACG